MATKKAPAKKAATKAAPAKSAPTKKKPAGGGLAAPVKIKKKDDGKGGSEIVR
jgi:hypothetical protein